LDKLNEQRESFLAEIRAVMDFNLDAVSKRVIKPGDALRDDDLFVQFCFFVKMDARAKDREFKYENLASEEIGFVLFVTDQYLSDGQIRCFANIFNFIRFKAKLCLDLFFTGNKHKVSDKDLFFFIGNKIYMAFWLKTWTSILIDIVT
jgi:hypothetical protein